MKKLLILSTACLLPLLVTGCLTFESAETRIKILKDDDDKYAQVTKQYNNFSSCEGLEKDIRNDFTNLIDMIEGDEYLLEAASEGYHLKERNIWIEDDKVNAKEMGITRDFDYLHKEFDLIEQGGEYLILADKSDIVVETNGKRVETDENIILFWPKKTEELYFKIEPNEDCNVFDQNRKLMVKWLREHQSKR